MIFALFTAVGVVLVVLTSAATWHRSLDRLLRQKSRQRVVVETTSGETFAGLLWSTDARHVLLRNTESLAPGRDPIRFDGDVLLPRTAVKVIQHP